MNATVERVEAAAVLAQPEIRIRVPLGLLGFERIKEYSLISNPGEEPFRWLQAVSDPSLAFLVLPPFEAFPAYRPDVGSEDTEFLGLASPSDAVLFNIVTLHRNRQATINLKGPVVININTLRAKQVVLANASQYALQEPLPTLE